MKLHFSESPIWQTQKETYAKSRSPFLITNNAKIAAQYADIACKLFGNRLFTILELGGGCGKFAFLLIQELLKRQKQVNYLLTDGSWQSHQFWEDHPHFTHWKRQNILQTAVLDPLIDPIPAADLILANYFFDSIPHDIVQGELIPVGALRVIDRLPKSALLLVADRGVHRKEDVCKMPLSQSNHGLAFSFAVNFHAIGLYLEKEGGSMIVASPSHPDLIVALMAKHQILDNPFDPTQTFGPLKTDATTFPTLLDSLREANWDATLLFSFFPKIEEMYLEASADEKKELREQIAALPHRFFPLFREEEVLLQQVLQFFGLSIEMKYQNLPSKIHPIETFIRSHSPYGSLLQIGERENASDAIVLENPKNYTQIPWGETIEGCTFDTIFLFPSRVRTSPKRPSWIRDIERQFSLEKILYSDEDLHAFIAQCPASQEEISLFLKELEQRGQITQKQLALFTLEEADPFFHTLQTALRKYMQPGATLYAYLPDIQTYEEPMYYEEIVVDPLLEIIEIQEISGMWLSISKFPIPAIDR